MKDYYQILGLPRKASQEHIRKQYRLLIVTWHPDKFRDSSRKEDAEERIKDINEAYEVLADKKKRSRYDKKFSLEETRKKKASEKSPSPSTSSKREKFLHYPFFAEFDDVVEVHLSRRANVILLDQLNYARYKEGGGFRYLGGDARNSHVTIPVPHPGEWHLVIDTGGRLEKVQAQVRVRRAGNWRTNSGW